MVITCFLGFHSWSTWFHKIGGTDKELRTCKKCSTTDMFIGFKFVRTNCLIKYVKPLIPEYEDIIDDWYVKYLEQKEYERVIRIG